MEGKELIFVKNGNKWVTERLNFVVRFCCQKKLCCRTFDNKSNKSNRAKTDFVAG